MSSIDETIISRSRDYLSMKLKDLVIRHYSELMPPMTVNENSSIRDVISIFMKYNVDAVIVTDKNNKPVGIVTDLDLLRLFQHRAHPAYSVAAVKSRLYRIPSLDLSVRDIMEKNPLTINYEKTVGEALDIMYRTHHTHIIIVDNENKVVGLLTSNYIFRKILGI